MENHSIRVHIHSLEEEKEALLAQISNLQQGEHLVITHHQDPKALYHHIVSQQGEAVDWYYTGKGPDVWEVRVEKSEQPVMQQKIGELVAADYRKADVFKRHGIDFCCGGKRKVSDACKEAQIDPISLQHDILDLDLKPKEEGDNFEEWPLDELADYIVNKHHAYVKDSSPLLYEYSQKIARVHGERHPELKEIAALTVSLIEELTQHMNKEEMVLFPYIQSLAQAYRDDSAFTPPPFGEIQNPIRMMEYEHDAAGRILDDIRRLTQNFEAPSNACATYRITFLKLKEFQDDLFRHIHLENNILFPKAIILERILLKDHAM